MLKPLPYLIYLSICLGLSALPSVASDLVPINLNSSAHTNWIKLQETGGKSDRQLLLAQIENILPVLATPSPGQPSPPIGQHQVFRPHIWRVRLITINESTRQPGYIDSQAEIDCKKLQMRVIQNVAVPYTAIQSPDAEVLEAYKKKLRLVQRESALSLFMTLQSTKDTPWQPIATTSPIHKFACDQPSWRNALKYNNNGPASVPINLDTKVLENSGFSFVGAFSVPAQDLFSHAWNKVWTDRERPAQFSQPLPANAPKVFKPPMPEYLETIAQASGMTGRAVGVAAVKPPLYDAFEQALQAGKSIRPEIDWLLSEGTIAGRIHGAVLLLHIDPKAGRQVLQQMRSIETVLPVSNGCMTSPEPVSTIVKQILSGQSFLPTPRLNPET